jgi:hypothetical protein
MARCIVSPSFERKRISLFPVLCAGIQQVLEILIFSQDDLGSVEAYDNIRSWPMVKRQREGKDRRKGERKPEMKRQVWGKGKTE